MHTATAGGKRLLPKNNS